MFFFHSFGGTLQVRLLTQDIFSLSQSMVHVCLLLNKC